MQLKKIVIKCNKGSKRNKPLVLNVISLCYTSGLTEMPQI